MSSPCLPLAGIAASMHQKKGTQTSPARPAQAMRGLKAMLRRHYQHRPASANQIF